MRLPVVEDGKVVGIITRGDVLQTMIWQMLVSDDVEGGLSSKDATS